MTSDPPFGTLQVDNGVQLKREVGGKLKGIQLYGKWYIGGVPPGVNMQNETKNLAAPSPSFDGSIQDVQVNGETITLAGMSNVCCETSCSGYDWLNFKPPIIKSSIIIEFYLNDFTQFHTIL